MVPTCGASRASLMTGIRLKENRFVTHLIFAEKDAPGIPTLNTHLKQNGFSTVSLGRFFTTKSDSFNGWTTPPWRLSGGRYGLRRSELLRQSVLPDARD